MCLPDDINNREVFRILHKVISKTITNLNKALMSNAENDTIEDFEMHDVTDWIMENGELVPLCEAISINISLTPEDFIIQILLESKGKYMTVS